MQNLPKIVRDRLKVVTPVSHPDAETLTAFSERLLPEAEHAVVMRHLSQCGDCREVVALALPEAESMPAVPGKIGSRRYAWPTLRWAFVMAGIAVISVGLVQYQRHSRNAEKMAYQALTRPQVPAKSTQALPAVTTPSPAQDRDKMAAELVAKNEAKTTAARQEDAPASVSGMKRFHGSAFGSTVGGPVSPNQVLPQWQQQNNVQNQVVLSTPAAGDATSQAAQTADSNSPQAAPFNTQLAKNQPGPAFGASGAGFAVDKAKLPVPPTAAANGTVRRQSASDKLSPQPAPGEIGGYVVDPSGAVVSNARITITPSQAGENVTAVTDSQGAWLIAGLPSGSYRAQAEAPGFKTTMLDLNYDASQPSMFSFTLSPGDVTETVEVSSAEMQVQAQGLASEKSEMKPAVGASEARVLNMEHLAAPSPARLPRWSISGTGTLQRSFDQGNTWQDVNVSRAAYQGRDLDISSGTASTKDAKAARAKEKSAGKKDAGTTVVFKAVTANGADVWAGGLNGSLYHSTDSGNRWTQVVPSSAGSVLTGDVVSIEFPDLQHGKLSTSTAETWITTDSGQTWQKQ